MRQLFDTVPVDSEAEERAWAVVRDAFAARDPVPARRRLVGPAVVLAAAALLAAALSPPGRAVVNAVRRSIGIEGAQPALFRLPAAGRLLVSGAGGTWVVAADGSTRRLGDYVQASWSPHGLFVVAATRNELAAVEPATGRVHWQLARPIVSFPRWGGMRADTRVAYLTDGRLHVVAGDGTGDRAVSSSRIAPVWQPGTSRHVLAYVDLAGNLRLVGAPFVSRAYAGARALAWSPDGKTLALAARGEVVLFAVATGRARVLHVADVRSLAFARDGRLAMLRARSVIVGGRTLFVAPSRLAGIAWSPTGRWLLTSLPDADQWVFVQTRGVRRVLAVSHIRGQFGGEPSLDGWASGQ
ncbi:MAG: hypothetical protein ACRDL2_08980 [Gaiellaceae bacterium]